MSTTYRLYYWPQIQGRGEFVRLALEEAGASYVDVARLPEEEGGGYKPMLQLIRGEDSVHLAPPLLQADQLVLSQTANICFFLGQQHGLLPKDPALQYKANQLQLCVEDLVAEAHDTHHPIATGLYYEEQKEEAIKRASFFTSQRLEKFLSFFERVLQANQAAPGEYLVGSQLTYVDLSIFQILCGLDYAFPNAFARVKPQVPGLLNLQERVAARPNIAEYLASDRRIPFNEDGIFRHYPELDE